MITVDCGTNGYIGQLTEFGFAYKMDKEFGGETEGDALCNHIENPLEPYKKPIAKPCAPKNATCKKLAAAKKKEEAKKRAAQEAKEL